MKNAPVSFPARVTAAFTTTRQLARALAMVKNANGKVVFSIDCSTATFENRFPFNVGVDKCVPTEDGDDVFYARVNRGRLPVWGKFVRGKKPQMSRVQTVIACKDGNQWNVIAAYIGGTAPQFPGDPTGDHQESVDFWSTHALIEGTVPHHKGTETTTCPW